VHVSSHDISRSSDNVVSSAADETTVTTTTLDTTTTDCNSVENGGDNSARPSISVAVTTPVKAAAMPSVFAASDQSMPIDAAVTSPGASPKSVKSVSSISSPSEEIARDVSERSDELNFPTAIPLSRKPETGSSSLPRVVSSEAKLTAVGVKEDTVVDSTVTTLPTQILNSKMSSVTLPGDMNQNGTSFMSVAKSEDFKDSKSKNVKPTGSSNEESKMDYEVNLRTGLFTIFLTLEC
jgi:hypothetical protein